MRKTSARQFSWGSVVGNPDSANPNIARGSEVAKHDDPDSRHEENPKFFMGRIIQSNILAAFS